MKRPLPHYLLTGCLSTVMAITSLPMIESVTAQTASPNDLSYSFYGQSIPLTLRKDVIAVDLKQTGTSRSRGEDPYLKLQKALKGGTRGGGPKLQVNIQPLSQGYAVVSFPSGSRSTPREVEQRVQKLPYVNGTVPVLSRQGRDETILLPNEIVVSLEAQRETKATEITLKRYGVEVIRPVAFSKNQVIVRATNAEGVEVLNIARQLGRAQGIRSATPNFIQTVRYRVPGEEFTPPAIEEPSNRQFKLQPAGNSVLRHRYAGLL